MYVKGSICLVVYTCVSGLAIFNTVIIIMCISYIVHLSLYISLYLFICIRFISEVVCANLCMLTGVGGAAEGDNVGPPVGTIVGIPVGRGVGGALGPCVAMRNRKEQEREQV